MWKIDKQSRQPVYQQIVALVLQKLETGELLPGEKIPPERQLASILAINRSTVVHALDELVAMGVLVRKQGSGTRVNQEKWGVLTKNTTNWRNYLTKGPFSGADAYLTALKAAAKQPADGLIDAYTGELPLDLLPTFDLPAISWKEFLREEDQQDELGYLPLRQAVQQLMKMTYNFSPPVVELMITAGAQQAIFLICQVLLEPGDAVAIESPSFFYLLPIFQAAGIRLYGVPMDQEGMKVLDLEKTINQHKIKMVFLHPNFQNPTGQTISKRRKEAIVSVCRQYQLAIVEDDAFGQLSFSTTISRGTIKELAPESVIYLGSLSKFLGSTTKIGWISAPKRVLERLADARQELDFGLSVFPQVLATQALTDPTFSAKLEILQSQLAERCGYLITTLQQSLVDEVYFTPPTGGYYLWVTSKNNPFDRASMNELLEQKILVLPSFLLGVGEQSLRINYARLSEIASRKLVNGLKQVLLG